MSATYGAAGARGVLSNPKKGGAVHRNQSTKLHDVTITKEDLVFLWEEQNGMCYWLDVPMSLDDLFISHSPFAVSVERLDSERGYHMDNVVLSTRFANKGRGAYDRSDFSTRLHGLLSRRKVRQQQQQDDPSYLLIKRKRNHVVNSLERFF